jgi:hypothetical protein
MDTYIVHAVLSPEQRRKQNIEAVSAEDAKQRMRERLLRDRVPNAQQYKIWAHTKEEGLTCPEPECRKGL